MERSKIKIRILIPLTLALAVLLVTFAFGVYRIQQNNISEDVVSQFESVQKLFNAKLDSDAAMLRSSLLVLIRDKQLQAALQNKDRKTLLELATPLFKRLRSESYITHFYFSDPDRVNVLRVHKPDKHGDVINRFTTLEAENTGKPSYGIELGPLGTFALRVVVPWWDGEQLIGYVELGEEIDHIIRELQTALDMEFYVVIEKRFLDRKNWETSLRMLGREGNWDRFPSVVMIDQTLDTFPEDLSHFLDERQHISGVTDVEVTFDDRHYRARFHHLDDAGGREVGDMVILRDVTERLAELNATVLAIAAACLAVGGTLFLFFYIFLGGVERKLVMATDGLQREIVERKQAEKRITQQTEFLNLVLQSLTHPFYVIDASDYTIKVANPAAHLGKLSEDTTCYALTHQRDTPCGSAEHLCPLEEIKKTKQPVSVEHLHYDKDGSLRNVEIHAYPIFDSEGNVSQIIEYTLDITKRKRAEEELKESREQLRNLSAYLQSSREQERASIAREIHDDLGQTLTALKMDLSWLGKRLPPDKDLLIDKSKSMSKIIDTSIQTVRRIITDLRPGILDDLGLEAAIEWQAEDFQTRTGIKFELTLDPEINILDQEHSTAIFRILQETLTNVARHAKATNVNISMREEGGEVVLEVRDNGKGITETQSSHPKSFGLMGIRERAHVLGGKAKISGIPGKGTTVTVRIPLSKE